MADAATTTRTVPSVDRTWALMESAYPAGITVLGYADSIVLADMPGQEMTFTVAPAVGRQEDEVLVVAVRLPHPEQMGLAEVIGEASSEDLA